MSTIDTLARAAAAAAANNPDSTIVDSPADAGAGEIMISCASAGTEHLGPASMNQTPDTSPSATNSANAELQRQLVLTWDSKRVKILEQQGERLQYSVCHIDAYRTDGKASCLRKGHLLHQKRRGLTRRSKTTSLCVLSLFHSPIV
jgi:hypothetical protein